MTKTTEPTRRALSLTSPGHCDRMLRLLRRRSLALALGALASTQPGLGWAQAAGTATPWPAGTLRIVTPTPVGVGIDAMARLYADHLGKALKTTVIVENRPGAAGTLGSDVVAKAAPNGLTLLVSTSLPITTAPYLLARMPYDPQKDLMPVAQLYRGGSFIVAGPAFTGRTLADLVAQAKARPGALDYASYGPGSTAHLGMELLQDMAHIRLNQIPYKQSAAPDLVGGQVGLGWEPPNSALPQIRSGKLRALAYTGDKRSSVLPEVPTLAESYPGLSLFTWVGVWVPAGTPVALVQRLHDVLNTITALPEVAKAVNEGGQEPMQTSIAQMTAQVASDATAMSRLIKAKGITLN